MNRKRISKAFWAIFFGITFGLVSQAVAEDFSADMTSRMGKETMQAKIFVSGEKVRMEMPESIMIIRGDKNVSWMIMPSENMYMEHPIDTSRAPRTSQSFDNEIERTSLGNEDVNGVATEKFKVSYLEKGKTESVYQWLSSAQIPVKIEAVDGSWGMEYKNISTAAQSADLFEIPADYTKMSMPSFGLGMGQ